MKNAKKDIRTLIFSGFILLLLIPFIQREFSIVNDGKLEGAFISKEKPVFNNKDWFSGKFQTASEEYLNESFGFRNVMVRLNNQIAFTFFRKANADNIVVDRNNYLFQKPTIDAYYGRDFLGDEVIERRMMRLKFISDTLAALHKNLVLILGTGKGSFYPEFIPEQLRSAKGSTNIEYHEKLANKLGLNYIDFNTYFIDAKNTSRYPLYPQYGIHWSSYGSFIVADSVIHYIESLRHTDLPEIISDSIAFRQPEKEEYDIAGGMNLLFRLKSFEMAYPKIHVEPDFGKTKPSVLVIGDSFYWGLQNMEISKAFSKTEFWFYNNRGTAGALKELPLLTRVRMAEEIKNFDVLILIATESNLPDLGWGFIENTYTYYKGIDPNRFDEFLFQEEVGDIKALLKKDPKKMERIMEVAAKNHISVDSMLTLRATTRAKNNRINKK